MHTNKGGECTDSKLTVNLGWEGQLKHQTKIER